MQNLPLNLPKLKHLISSGLAALPKDKKHQNAILVLGDTGVGKTTILSYLGHKKLVVRMHGLNAVLDGQGERLGIGHDRLSETRVPSKVIIDDLVFFDCAGFGDNRGEEVEISNSFFVKRLFSLYKNVKILLMIDEHSVSQARASKLPKLVRKLLHSFQDLKDIQDGVVLVINRAKQGYNETDYCDELVKIAHLKTEGQYMFKAQQRAFIEHLVKRKRVSLFFQAEKQQEGKPLQQKPNKMLELIRDANYVRSKKIKNIISEGAKLAIREMIDEFGNEAEKKIEKLCSNMVKEIVISCRKGFGGNLTEAMKAKQTVVELIKNISESKNDELIDMMREKIPTVDFTSLHQDIAAVMFFNNIYPRADEYFNSLKAKMSGKLSQTLMELDSEIMILQQHEKEMNELKIKCQTLEHRNSELSEKVHTCERKNILIETEKNQLSGQVETLQLKMGEMNSQKDAQIDSLSKSLQELQINNKSLEEELSLLNIQNESIRGELLEHQKMETESMASVCSKSSKYPEVICPHFLNGGKCRHCIKQWKDEQKKFKKQMKQNQGKLNN